MADKLIFLTNTVVFQGRHYPPGGEYTFPEEIADEIIEKDAGEPVLEVKNTTEISDGKKTGLPAIDSENASDGSSGNIGENE